MWYFILAIVVLTIIIQMAKWALIAGAALAAAGAALFGTYLFYTGLRRIYHVFNPSARKAFLERRALENAKWERNKKLKEKQKAEKQKRKEEREREKRDAEESKARAFREDAERQERERQRHRDADAQETPYTYKTGQHANEALAIRYGIANLKRKVEEYHYFARGAIRKRNPSRDKTYWVPAKTIEIRKIRYLGKGQFIAALPDHGDRKVRVVIEKGTEYVKTFLPISDEWFETHRKLEETLKNNRSFTLKELASFHVQKAI